MAATLCAAMAAGLLSGCQDKKQKGRTADAVAALLWGKCAVYSLAEAVLAGAAARLPS